MTPRDLTCDLFVPEPDKIGVPSSFKLSIFVSFFFFSANKKKKKKGRVRKGKFHVEYIVKGKKKASRERNLRFAPSRNHKKIIIIINVNLNLNFNLTRAFTLRNNNHTHTYTHIQWTLRHSLHAAFDAILLLHVEPGRRSSSVIRPCHGRYG